MVKKNLRVFLQYPIGISDSQYYKSLIDNPPKGIIYSNVKKKEGMIVDNKKFKGLDNFKRVIKFFLERIPLPIPTAKFTKTKEEFDLIHCAHCLSLNNFPWVVDVEFGAQLWCGVDLTPLRKKTTLKLLKSDKCKKIIAWTEETKRNLIKDFPEIKDKVEVVYYAMPTKIKKRPLKKSKQITLFFSGRHFYAKGGLHATEVMDRITKKYPFVNGIVNGSIPEEVIKKYSGNKKIKFLQLMPYKEVLEVYKNADIYVYPGYSDSFGFTYMEAMAFGLPIVTVDGYSRREIISNLKQGFILDKPNRTLNYESIKYDEDLIKKMMEKTEILIKDKSLRDRMSKNCLKEISDGKFSLKKRNEKLKRIYEEALR